MSDPEAPVETPLVDGHLPHAADVERIPREIWVLVAAAFVIAIGFGLIAPVLPQYATSFGVGATQAGYVVAVFALVRLLFAPGGGRLVGIFGERRVYLAGLLIVAASSAATAFAHTYIQLLIYRGLGGIGSVMFTVSAGALLVRLAPPALRARVSSAYASAFLVGGILGPVLGGVLGGFGLAVPFLGYAALLVVAALVVAVFIPANGGGVSPGTSVLPVLPVREALRDSAYRAALVSSFANGWGNFGFRNAVLPLFVASLATGHPAYAGYALAAVAAGNALGLTYSGRAADRIGRRPFILLGLVVSGLATAVTGLAPNLLVLFALCIIAGIGVGTLGPAQQASVADVIGRERGGGPAMATYMQMSDLGAFLGPIAGGFVVDASGHPAAFAVTGILTVAAAIPWLLARETLTRP